mmetsp:Transcript_25102/g.54641  ORF Transcript_25102/g.54641 Transcript_25102/m.54641 type:complete len:481 (+) Transcript_25102:253-1695(+)
MDSSKKRKITPQRCNAQPGRQPTSRPASWSERFFVWISVVQGAGPYSSSTLVLVNANLGLLVIMAPTADLLELVDLHIVRGIIAMIRGDLAQIVGPICPACRVGPRIHFTILQHSIGLAGCLLAALPDTAETKGRFILQVSHLIEDLPKDRLVSSSIAFNDCLVDPVHHGLEEFHDLLRLPRRRNIEEACVATVPWSFVPSGRSLAEFRLKDIVVLPLSDEVSQVRTWQEGVPKEDVVAICEHHIKACQLHDVPDVLHFVPANIVQFDVSPTDHFGDLVSHDRNRHIWAQLSIGLVVVGNNSEVQTMALCETEPILENFPVSRVGCGDQHHVLELWVAGPVLEDTCTESGDPSYLLLDRWQVGRQSLRTRSCKRGSSDGGGRRGRTGRTCPTRWTRWTRWSLQPGWPLQPWWPCHSNLGVCLRWLLHSRRLHRHVCTDRKQDREDDADNDEANQCLLEELPGQSTTTTTAHDSSRSSTGA